MKVGIVNNPERNIFYLLYSELHGLGIFLSTLMNFKGGSGDRLNLLHFMRCLLSDILNAVVKNEIINLMCQVDLERLDISACPIVLSM